MAGADEPVGETVGVGVGEVVGVAEPEGLGEAGGVVVAVEVGVGAAEELDAEDGALDNELAELDAGAGATRAGDCT
ncbi:MAG: hypothetical protein QOG07_1054 [Pseudonocardiales bacterium]|nr:hypothetical protein [Pseudonocardiales bacterium]